MNVNFIRSDGIYAKIMKAPLDKKEDIYRYELMMPFEKKWACYSVPMKAATPNGYDVIMASGMLGHIAPTKVDETQRDNIERISSDRLWSECKQSVEKSLKCFSDAGIELPVQEYLFTILLANAESPYTSMNEGYCGDGGIPGYIFSWLIPNDYTLEHLPVALAHETNHNVRFQFIKWRNDITLGEMMVSEGLAENFATYLYGEDKVGPWVKKTDIETLNKYIKPIIYDLGVAGAAIATAISQVVSTLVYLFYIFGKKSVFDFKIKNYCLSKEVASEIFKIGIPTLVFQILTSLSISLINNAAADYGDAAIAGMGVVTRLVSMGSLTIFGFIKGFQPIAGYSYGAKKFNRLHEAIKTSIIWSTIFCVVYGLILALFSTSIVSQFASGNLEMIKVGASSLRVNGISLMLFGFYTVYSSLFLALGKGKEGFILGACRQGICFVPVILVLPMIWGLNGILYAQPVADVLSAIITVFMAIHLHRELNEAEKQAAIAGTNEVH